MISKRARLTQTLFEALLPILGYFYWNWDASFVLLWFGMDWLVGLFLTYLKSVKRYHYSRQVNEQRLAKRRLFVASIAFIFTAVVTWFTLPRIEVDFSWKERIWAFLSYADMGIPQGIILVPLIALNGYLLYNKVFVKFRLYERIGMSQLTNHLPWESILTSSFGIIGLTVSFFTSYPSELILFGSLLGITLFRLRFRD